MRPLSQVRKFLFALWALLAFQTAGSAQALDAPAIDALIQDALKAWQVPGAAVVIVRGDEVVYLKGFGVKEAGGSQPVTPDTLFAIASCSKAFTTTAIAMLADDGKLAWDDPVRKHVEFFRLSDPLADRDVTLRDLVTHRTGLARHDLLWHGSPWGREEIIRKIGLVNLSRPFRSKLGYQNIMYSTAGYAAGAATKSSWEEVVQKRIFDPLGMAGANCSATVAAKARDHATPHLRNQKEKVEAIAWRNIDNIGPAGSINASARDLSKWLRFQLGDGTFEGKRLISTARLKETHTPQMAIPLDGSTGSTSYTQAMNPETTMMSYGLGWVIHDYRGHLVIWHGGSIDGFRSQVALVPRAKLAVAIVSNLGRTEMPIAIRNGIIDQLLNLPKKDWNRYYLEQVKQQEAAEQKRIKERDAKRRPGTKPSRELTAYAGDYDEPAYGRATVSVENDGLVLQWSNFKARLEHFHFDTFVVRGDPLIENREVVFNLRADGEVKQISFLGQNFKKSGPRVRP